MKIKKEKNFLTININNEEEYYYHSQNEEVTFYYKYIIEINNTFKLHYTCEETYFLYMVLSDENTQPL